MSTPQNSGKFMMKEYSEKVYKELIDRYKKQNRNLEDDLIRYYVSRFDQLKNSIRQRFEKGDETITSLIPKQIQEKNKYLDVLQWPRFVDLEKIIDIFPAPKSQQKKPQEDTNEAETDADKVYDKNGLEIYQGNSQGKCVKYGARNGNKYSWCISRPDTSNMYSNYRFMGDTSRMFYFVVDRDKSSRKNKDGKFEDPNHAVVIHVYENGSYGFSNANNAGDSSSKTWEGLGQFMDADLWRKLKPLKDVFKYIGPSQEEKELAALKGKKLTAEQFADLSYQTKLAYINGGNKLTPEQIDTLDTELKNQYINIGGKMPIKAIINNVPLIKRYITLQFDRQGNPVNADYIKFMTPEQKQKYFEKYKEEAQTDYKHIAEYFPEYAVEFTKDFIDQLVYLPDYFEKYMTPAQKSVWYAYNHAYDSSNINTSEDKQDLLVKYHFNIKTLEQKDFDKIPEPAKSQLIKLVKKLVESDKLSSYQYLEEALPPVEIKNGDLYFNFKSEDGGDNWVNVEQENQMNESWTKRTLQHRAGIIK